MPFVVDASITACWLMPDGGHPNANSAFARLTDDQALVPVIWWFEIRNVLLTGERRKRTESGLTAQALLLLADLPIRVDHAPQDEALLRLARRHQLTVYDAAYLELALRESVPLATLDLKLAAGARAERVSVLGPA